MYTTTVCLETRSTPSSKALPPAMEADTSNNDQFTSKDKLEQGPCEPVPTQEDGPPANKQEDKEDGCDFSEPD